MKKKNILSDMFGSISLSGPQLGVAFSGGGARGFSHIGLILALEKFGIRASCVSGVSSGSIAAAMYGCGMRASEMRECFKDHLKFSDYRDWMVPTDGIMSLRKFHRLLLEWLPYKRIEQLPVPTYICATDLDHGKSVGFTSGELAKAVVASCSIPIIFPPQKIHGINYVDGGVLRNLPAWAIRDKCTVLLGSHCNPLDHEYVHKKSILSIALRSYVLMSKSNTLPDIELCDYLVHNPKLSKYCTFNVRQMDRIIIDGYDAAAPVIEKIAKQYFS